MAERIGNLTQSGILPPQIHYLRGVRAIFALALLAGTALVLAWIARSSSDARALIACLAASVVLLACAGALTRSLAAVPTERLALGTDAIALFAVAMLAPTLILDDWNHSELTAAILALVAAGSMWTGRIAAGEAPIRMEALKVGSILAAAICAALWILGETGSVGAVESPGGPIALAATAPLFSAGATSRQLASITLGVAASALAVIAVLVMPDHALLLAIAAMACVWGIVATRPRDHNIPARLDALERRPSHWLTGVTLLSIAAVAVLVDGNWRWLAIASFAVVAVVTISAQGVDIVARDRMLSRLTRLVRQTASQARLDPLTRLPNRAALDARLNEEVERAIRYRHPAAVLFVDVDHFKSINDLCGHEAGDEALREIGATIRTTIRTPDFVARFGGEEFVVIAPGTWSLDAAVLGRRIQAAVGEAVLHGDGNPVTVSVGIAGVPEHGASADDVLRTADEALYRAKRAGRNRVEIAPAPGNQDLRDNS